MYGIIRPLKAIREAADEAIQLVQLGGIADLLDRMDFMADQGKSIIEHLKQLLCKTGESIDQVKDLGMSPHSAALLIQRYATLALEGLRRTDATADSENRLIDIEALARDIANDLRPIQDESSEQTGP